jgi:hypothetical protein
MAMQAPQFQRQWPLYGLAIAYLGLGLWTIWIASPRVPYADPWRFLANFLETPFPANALAADNGHREVIPNLVRIAELHWLAADQSLQLLLGSALLLLVACACWRTCRPTHTAATPAVAVVIAAGIYWLGNARKLAHGNELFSMACVLAGLCLALRSAASGPGQAPTVSRAGWAAAGGLLATLSFGSGFAVFAAIGAVMLLQRIPLRTCWPVAAMAAMAVWLLRHGGGGAAATVELRPLVQLDQWLRWLGAPLAWILSPILDPAHAARQPIEWLRGPLVPLAQWIEQGCGPHLQARFPGLLAGALGLVAMGLRFVDLWRRRGGSAGEQFAHGLCWFGLGVGGLVVAVRSSYFDQAPDQLTSQRYLPWSMLFWTGLCLGPMLRPNACLRRTLLLACCFALLLAPSQLWTGRYAWQQRQTAERTALGAAVAVLPEDFALVETEWRDLVRAIPKLQQAGTAMFAWPETRALGSQPPADSMELVTWQDLRLSPVRNRLGPPGMRIFARMPGQGRLVVLDRDGVVRGILQRLPVDNGWHGWLRGEAKADDLRAARLR